MSSNTLSTYYQVKKGGLFKFQRVFLISLFYPCLTKKVLCIIKLKHFVPPLCFMPCIPSLFVHNSLKNSFICPIKKIDLINDKYILFGSAFWHDIMNTIKFHFELRFLAQITKQPT